MELLSIWDGKVGDYQSAVLGSWNLVKGREKKGWEGKRRRRERGSGRWEEEQWDV